MRQYPFDTYYKHVRFSTGCIIYVRPFPPPAFPGQCFSTQLATAVVRLRAVLIEYAFVSFFLVLFPRKRKQEKGNFWKFNRVQKYCENRLNFLFCFLEFVRKPRESENK